MTNAATNSRPGRAGFTLKVLPEGVYPLPLEANTRGEPLTAMHKALPCLRPPRLCGELHSLLLIVSLEEVPAYRRQAKFIPPAPRLSAGSAAEGHPLTVSGVYPADLSSEARRAKKEGGLPRMFLRRATACSRQGRSACRLLASGGQAGGVYPANGGAPAGLPAVASAKAGHQPLSTGHFHND